MFRGVSKCRKLPNVFEREIRLFKIEPKSTPKCDFEVPRKMCRCSAKSQLFRRTVEVAWNFTNNMNPLS